MASPPLLFHPEARLEALEAFDWYSHRSQQAADAFEEELRDAGRAIEHSPELWAHLPGGYASLPDETFSLRHHLSGSRGPDRDRGNSTWPAKAGLLEMAIGCQVTGRVSQCMFRGRKRPHGAVSPFTEIETLMGRTAFPLTRDRNQL